jgi:hypothetical protein
VPRQHIAVVCVDDVDEVTTFVDWLRRNRPLIVGISENRGCGCCVDMFDVLVDDRAEPMPCSASGDFDKSTILFGDEGDRVLNQYCAAALSQNR